MSEPPKSANDDVAPTTFANVSPPRDLHPTSDIRFVISELAKFGERLDRLIRDMEKQSDKIEKQSDKLRSIETSIDRVITGVFVAGVILSIVGAVFWWALGDRITSAVHAGLGQAAETHQAAPIPVTPTTPDKPKG